MKLIIGLGNPGRKYQNTRHNIGWTILDIMAEKNKWHKSSGHKLEYCKIELDDQEVALIKPLTFMNNSGSAVSFAIKKHHLSLDDIIVIHDDLDIQLGEYKIQRDRSAAGHNGVKSIIEHLGSQNFTRIRVGIGKEDKGKQGPTERFVLKKFSLLEKMKLKSVKEQIIKEIKNLP